MLLPNNIRIVSHETARDQAIATAHISKGSTISTFSSLATVLLPSQKGRRCDTCFRASSEQRTLRKCTGCASYWYCDSQCQNVQWKAHHKKLCSSYHQFTTSYAFQSLPSHEQLDALLLAHLLAQISASGQSSQDDSSPMTVLRSLIPGPQAGAFVLPIPGLKPPVSLESAKYLYSRFGNNNFAIHSHLITVGHGIFPLASRLFNHSCSPNAAAKYAFAPSTPVTMEVVALQNIPQNEEICLPYLDPALLQTRQKIFEYTYGFRCTCPSCRKMELLGEIPSPPSRPEDLTSVAKTLRKFVGLEHPLKGLPSKPKEAIPQSLLCVFHETYLSNLSEEFSKSSHEGQYDVALDAGIALLGAYIMIYPPNYPQVGMHLLELAKTAWNMFIISGETDAEAAQVLMGAPRSGMAQAMVEQVQVFLNMACDTLVVYGSEGDEDGPLEEIKTLQSLLDT